MPRTLLQKIRVGMNRVNWTEFIQSFANGVANTIGTIVIYTVIIISVIFWYRGSKNAKDIQHGALTDALSYTRIGMATNNANNTNNANKTHVTESQTSNWI